ncbi:MAG: uracil-DNA glycosylase [Candidatus Arsenophonus melophagi]|nr:uracil-DNA glycosylase [Candidatus Arsenophonus melophagi]
MSDLLTWRDVIGSEKKQAYFRDTLTYIDKVRQQGKIIFPSKNDVFNAFRYTELSKVRVVILGQDPYHCPNQAHGLAFSVRPGVPIPPSLLNIYKELERDIVGFKCPNHGYLISWAQQGILLLNTILTVEKGKAHSHSYLGWEIFSDKVIAAINQYRTGVVFLLWGVHAQKKDQFIDKEKHFILKAAHPSPFSAYRGFFGCKHFSKTNEFLIRQGSPPIDWTPFISKKINASHHFSI